MMDLYQAFLAQKRDLELRSRRREHLYWGLEPREPWPVRAWRRLSARRHQPARRRTPLVNRPSWTMQLDAPGGETSA